MLNASGYPVATCCDMLGDTGSDFKIVKFFMQHLQMLHDVVVVWLGLHNDITPRHVHYFDFQPPTYCNMSQ